ncbi:uncharacterized protein EI90DRAFT_3015277 [Cantharellus anzutake]|uniref:uncharacterized protein n=1 Tax=Cantharellus anzutake TaxID=1750568 RepID=UPI001904726E|nr:uncharacterized protein EI90DRAFT_3015277 [Cantharellus anzutake]KAF8334282.1 hypothetical protein EI90DRAFT_3015277 [Cantharellus anzutake]
MSDQDPLSGPGPWELSSSALIYTPVLNSNEVSNIYVVPEQEGTSPSSTGSTPAIVFNGNLLFWTSSDPRETAIWGKEVVYDTNQGFHIQRKIEYSITTPAGYSVQTKSFIRPGHDGPSAEFWWASLTQLGLCVSNDTQIPMAHFLREGSTSDCSRFYIPGDGRCFEWCRSTLQPLTFALYEVPSGKACAEFIGGPFETDDLYPYMQYHWSHDDTLLLFAVISITIRRWMDLHKA